MPARDVIIGIDLGGTHFQVGAVDAYGDIIARTHGRTPEDGQFEAVCDALAADVHAVCDQAGLSLDQISAVGIGAPGAVVPSTGVVLQAGNLPWDNVPLGAALTSRLQGRLVFVDNDVNAATVGEHRLGAGRGATDMLGIWVGTGIGGGFILNGTLHRGTYYSAGEIGQTVPNPHEPPPTRRLERRAARSAIAARIARAKGTDPDDMTASRIAELYRTGDADANAAVTEATELIGVAVANAITLLSLGRVVVGGGIVEQLGEAFVGPIADAARRDVFPDECRQTPFVPTSLGADAGLLGASLIARDALASRR